MNSAPKLSIHPVLNWMMTRHKLFIRGVILFSILICTIIIWFHLEQRHFVERTVGALENINRARLDLVKGFLHVSMAEKHLTAFSAEQGYALLRQAAASLDKEIEIVDRLPYHKSVGPSNRNIVTKDFHQEIASFLRLLNSSDLRLANKDVHQAKLRIAFANLERQANQVDQLIREEMRLWTENLESDLFVTLAVSVILLSLICTAVVISGSAKERSDRTLKENEKALNESNNRLRFALEGTNDGLWDVQMKTGEVYLSPRGCQILGYEAGELPSVIKIWNELVHPEDMPKTLECLNAHLEGREVIFNVEQRLGTKSGAWKWIQARGKVVAWDTDGTPLRMIGTHTDISDRKMIEEDIRRLNRHLQTSIEAERKRISREIHDDLGQTMTAMRMNLAQLERSLKSPDNSAAPELLQAEVRGMTMMIDESVASVQKIIHDLRPVVLDTQGLREGLLWLVDDFQKRYSILCVVQFPESLEAVDSDRSTIIFRILQEALTNIARHAKASKVEVILSLDSSMVTLTVRDDGQGIRQEDHLKMESFGLLGIRERVQAFAGNMKISSKRREGTEILVRLPIMASYNKIGYKEGE